MQVRNADATAGVHSSSSRSTPAIRPFEGLGELPGLAHVGPAVSTNEAIVLVHPLRLPRDDAAGFPDLREFKWLRDPPSGLLSPLTHDIDVTRRLSERTVGLGASGRKRKRETADGQAPQATALALADPRDGLALAAPGRHHLGDVAAAMAQALLRQADARSAEALGIELARQLGSGVKSREPVAMVLRGVLSCMASPDAGVAAPGAAPLSKLRAEVLGDLLRGVGFGLTGACDGLSTAFIEALQHQACLLAIDPLYDRPQASPRSADFALSDGPLQVVAAALRLGGNSRQMMVSWARFMLARIEGHLQVWHGNGADTQALFIEQASQWLGSLGWLMARVEPSRLAQRFTVVEALSAQMGRARGDLLPVGIVQAQALRAASPGILLAPCLEKLVFLNLGGAARVGDIAWGLMQEGAAGDPLDTLLQLAPALRPCTLATAMFAVAVSAGVRGRWLPHAPLSPATCWVQRSLDALSRLDAQRQRTLALALLRALQVLQARDPAFKVLREAVDAEAARRLVPRGVSHQALTLASRIVDDPRVAFEAETPEGPNAQETLDLVLTDWQLRPDRTASLVRDCVDFVLRSTAPARDRNRLLLPLVNSWTSSIAPRQLQPVRQLLVAGLADRLAPPATVSAEMHSPHTRMAQEGLRALYAALMPGLGDGGATARREYEALSSTALPLSVQFALSPVLPALKAYTLPPQPSTSQPAASKGPQ